MAKIGETVFGDEWELRTDGWDTANRFVREGKGILVVSNHPTILDGPRLVSLLLTNPEFRGKRMVVPVAKHQFGVSKMLNDVTGVELDLVSVVTPDAVRKRPELAQISKQGFFDYGRKGREALTQGGIVILFPQAERRPTIGEALPTDKTIEMMVRIGENTGMDFGILPVGITVPGVAPDKANGLNIGHKAVLRVGDAFSRSELRETAREVDMTTDSVIYRNLQALVDEEYR